MFRELKRYQWVTDVSVAGVFFLLFIPLLLHENAATAVLVHLVFSAALALRRLQPGWALAGAWAGAILQMAFLLQSPSVSDVAALAVLYTTAAYGVRVIRWLGLASAGFGALVATAYLIIAPQALGGGFEPLGDPGNLVRAVTAAVFLFFSCLAVLGLSWTVGLLVRTYRRARASRRAQDLAELDVVVEQERTRIARDMHDVVAHSLAVVIAQADGARYARANDPEAVDAALTTISATAREALGDVRVLLSQLRHSQGEAPQPVLADLERLIDQLRASGLEIGREERGEPVTLATGQQLAVYRIVQEAFTNVLRHGDTAQPVRLVFDWMPGAVSLRVASRVRADAQPPARPPGHGLAGMRERALLVGGTLTAGPDEHGGWAVVAFVPAGVPSEVKR